MKKKYRKVMKALYEKAVKGEAAFEFDWQVLRNMEAIVYVKYKVGEETFTVAKLDLIATIDPLRFTERLRKVFEMLVTTDSVEFDSSNVFIEDVFSKEVKKVLRDVFSQFFEVEKDNVIFD